MEVLIQLGGLVGRRIHTQHGHRGGYRGLEARNHRAASDSVTAQGWYYVFVRMSASVSSKCPQRFPLLIIVITGCPSSL